VIYGVEEFGFGEGFAEGEVGAKFLGHGKVGAGADATAAGHGDDFRGGSDFAEFLDCFQAVDVGHEHVRDDDVEGFGLGHLDAFAAAVNGGNFKTGALQNNVERFANGVVV